MTFGAPIRDFLLFIRLCTGFTRLCNRHSESLRSLVHSLFLGEIDSFLRLVRGARKGGITGSCKSTMWFMGSCKPSAQGSEPGHSLCRGSCTRLCRGCCKRTRLIRGPDKPTDHPGSRTMAFSGVFNMGRTRLCTLELALGGSLGSSWCLTSPVILLVRAQCASRGYATCCALGSACWNLHWVDQ